MLLLDNSARVPAPRAVHALHGYLPLVLSQIARRLRARGQEKEARETKQDRRESLSCRNTPNRQYTRCGWK